MSKTSTKGRVAAPQVLTANDLRNGAVVFLDQTGGWSTRIADAEVIVDPARAALLLEEANARQATELVGPYLVDIDDATGKPLHLRELIRAEGPTAPVFA